MLYILTGLGAGLEIVQVLADGVVGATRLPNDTSLLCKVKQTDVSQQLRLTPSQS